MKFLKPVFIVFFISLLGELLNLTIPLPVPAGVYGMLIMLGALCTGIIKLPEVEEFGRFMIELLPLMFIPGAAGVVVHYKEVAAIAVPYVLIMITTTFIVMGAAGMAAQRVITRKRKWKK